MNNKTCFVNHKLDFYVGIPMVKIKSFNRIFTEKRVCDVKFFFFSQKISFRTHFSLCMSCLNYTFKSHDIDTTSIFNLLLSTNFFAQLEMEYGSGRVFVAVRLLFDNMSI